MFTKAAVETAVKEKMRSNHYGIGLSSGTDILRAELQSAMDGQYSGSKPPPADALAKVQTYTHTTDFQCLQAPPAPEPVLIERAFIIQTIDLTPVEFSVFSCRMSKKVYRKQITTQFSMVRNMLGESPVEAACVPCVTLWAACPCSNDIKKPERGWPCCRTDDDRS
nr:hypothetical protein Iba_chr05aCG5900 [Ipomoea batatas]